MSDESPLPAGHKAVRVRIHGRVQGVWYRAWTVETARGLGLDGWVRNRLDNTVEALFVGTDAVVDTMVQHCWSGPERAEVTHIALEPALGITASGFVQKPTV